MDYKFLVTIVYSLDNILPSPVIIFMSCSLNLPAYIVNKPPPYAKYKYMGM